MQFLRILLQGLGVAAVLAAQAPAPPDLVFRRSVQEVVLDLVVRNKHERMIRDLTADQIEVYEDGVKQDLRSFRFVSGAEVGEAEEQAAAHQKTSGASVTPLHGLDLVLIVFRTMGSPERMLAKQLADDFLANELRPNTLVGIFSMDSRLKALQQFTNDTSLLKRAVNHAVSGAHGEFANQPAAPLTGSQPGMSGGRAVFSSKTGEIDFNRPAGSVSLAETPSGGLLGVQYMRRFLLDPERKHFSGIAGMGEMDSLKILVEQLGLLPGRKTVLMLSTGLQLPVNQMEVFRNLQAAANRNNITFYAVDVNGLTSNSSIAASTALLDDINNAGSPDVGTVEYALRSNQQESLRELSENTGGFLIANTNDARKLLRNVMEDVNTHYEIAYSPKSDLLDGHFRKIAVKLLREGLHVQNRAGYFALPDLDGKPLKSYEVPALEALNRKPLPRSFQFHLSAQRFRPEAGKWQQSMTFEIPTAALIATSLENPARQRIHPTFFAVIKDSEGQIVEKLSRDIPYEIPAGRFDDFKTGNIVVALPFSLGPGHYTIESALVDQESDAASAKRVSLVLPEPGPVAVSSVSMVRRVDPLKDPADPLDPFQFPGTKVTPTLAATFPKGAQPTVYFVVYPSEAMREKPNVVVQYFKNGAEISRQTPEIGDSQRDPAGGIPLLATAKLEPGQYEVRVTLVQGKDAAQQSTTFTVEN